jgi:hypothetical protein
MMRYAIFGALILGLELLGVSVTAAMPANKNAVVKIDSRDVIETFAGCGKNYKPNKQTHKCEPY